MEKRPHFWNSLELPPPPFSLLSQFYGYLHVPCSILSSPGTHMAGSLKVFLEGSGVLNR
jgi:hypothetical protein